ncbi:hypothetical protein C5E07_17885 [Pseudoclavibacter sp. RFBJ3]|nr:hypothetical protein C5C12_00945 [Pseudoclavibacter sp. RFBJ5]PPF89451.1 hypothetical protein C5E07_17885 [Pseudoclavibacter sp. RFBJ3]PPG00744.1 hypothetical protein C5C19_00855 [Pseudoclavibacter sp. RFBH5]PPG18852.1 hypothetical protein C5E13_17660 [Pseudoclavibacter sp. RFBI4]
MATSSLSRTPPLFLRANRRRSSAISSSAAASLSAPATPSVSRRPRSRPPSPGSPPTAPSERSAPRSDPLARRERTETDSAARRTRHARTWRSERFRRTDPCMTATTLVTGSRKPGILTALAAVVVYVALAAGLGNLLSSLVSDDQEVAQFALGHLIPLPIGIALLLLYVRWTGNAEQVWRERPTPTLTPPRWYLVSIPILMTASSLAVLTEVAWAEQTLALIAVITLGTLLVGFGEELAIRGVLLAAVRQRQGEFAVLLITSLVFALAHIPGSVIAGAPPATIAFQLGGLMIAGASYYWIRRVTGRLWVGALIHAFSDWGLYLAGDAGTQAASVPNSHEAPADPFIGTLGVVLWIILAVGVVSVIREDRRNRRQDASSL